MPVLESDAVLMSSLCPVVAENPLSNLVVLQLRDRSVSTDSDIPDLCGHSTSSSSIPSMNRDSSDSDSEPDIVLVFGSLSVEDVELAER